MRRRIAAVASLAAVLLLGAGMLGVTSARAPLTPALGLDLEIAPHADDAEVLRGVFTLRDLETGEVVARPRLFLPRGESATIEQGSIDRVIRIEVRSLRGHGIEFEAFVVDGSREYRISRGSVTL